MFNTIILVLFLFVLTKIYSIIIILLCISSFSCLLGTFQPFTLDLLNFPTAGVDYTIDAPDAISITSSSTICVTVDILDDQLSDGDKTLNLQLNTNDQSVDIVSSTTSIFIIDNDGMYIYYNSLVSVYLE